MYKNPENLADTLVSSDFVNGFSEIIEIAKPKMLPVRDMFILLSK